VERNQGRVRCFRFQERTIAPRSSVSKGPDATSGAQRAWGINSPKCDVGLHDFDRQPHGLATDGGPARLEAESVKSKGVHHVT
jgi:hypothetical protein